MIKIRDDLRLRPISQEDYVIALPWYKNKLILKYSENVSDYTYDLKIITRMYDHLNKLGQVFFIEVFEEDWKPIGDVTLSSETMPIVIDPSYWGKGIGKQVITALLNYGVSNDMHHFKLKGIYSFNHRSINLYKSCGFTITAEDESSVYMEYKK